MAGHLSSTLALLFPISLQAYANWLRRQPVAPTPCLSLPSLLSPMGHAGFHAVPDHRPVRSSPSSCTGKANPPGYRDSFLFSQSFLVFSTRVHNRPDSWPGIGPSFSTSSVLKPSESTNGSLLRLLVPHLTSPVS